VLSAIAERPGSSNRRIGNAAGVVDQGQISKLLQRLARLGLISNDGSNNGRGAENSWSLTASGARVLNATALPAGRDGR
jgi:DNA-binding PadR family transcriptional regulator